jgi:hypothetical protein
MLDRVTSLKAIAGATAVFLAANWIPLIARGEPSHRHDRGDDGRTRQEYQEQQQQQQEHQREQQQRQAEWEKQKAREGDWDRDRALLAPDPAVREFLIQLLERREETEREDRDAAIHDMMEELRQLRIMQVNLERDMQHAEVSSDHLKHRDLQREMIELQHQMQVSQLELEGVMVERERDTERRQMSAMNERFEYVAGWREVAFDPAQAVMMATQAIVELHLAMDDANGAAHNLEALLEKVDGAGSRTAIRFALRDIYTELGRLDKAAEHMSQVILENSRRGDSWGE